MGYMVLPEVSHDVMTSLERDSLPSASGYPYFPGKALGGDVGPGIMGGAGQNASVLGRLQFNFHRAAMGFLLALEDRTESGSSRRRGREAASRSNGAMLQQLLEETNKEVLHKEIT